MDDQRFYELTDKFSEIRIGVLGDFFLDLYFSMDRNNSELSLETKKEAYQVDGYKSQPGAAGVVAINLAALGAEVTALTVLGEDGFGFELKNALQMNNIGVESLLASEKRHTPTYIKPMMTEVDGEIIELNRLDIKNRTAIPAALELDLIRIIKKQIEILDGILVGEQVSQDGTGVMTKKIRDELGSIALENPGKIFGVDSRDFSFLYKNLFLKVNLEEAMKAAEKLDSTALKSIGKKTLDIARTCQSILWKANQKPVFITLGDQGISGFAAEGEFYFPSYQVSDPVDIVGAGDSVLAGVGISLCAGAEPEEAAYIGNLVGSLIVEQIGTTGIATLPMLKQRHKDYQAQK